MEQKLELAARAEGHQAIQRKNSQNQPDTTSQQETPIAARQRGMRRKKGRGRNEKSGKEPSVWGGTGENVRKGVSRRGAQWFGKGEGGGVGSALIKPAKLEFSHSE